MFIYSYRRSLSRVVYGMSFVALFFLSVTKTVSYADDEPSTENETIQKATEVAKKAATPADRIFPKTTIGFFSISDLEELGKRWKETQFGQLVADPIMKPFKEEIQHVLERAMKNRFGMTLDGIEQLPSGEIAVGMIAIPDKRPGYVLTLDVADRVEQTKSYLERLSKKFAEIGVKQEVEKIGGFEITVYTFPKATEPEKSDSAKSNAPTKPNPAPVAATLFADRKAYYLLEGNTLIVSDQGFLIELIAGRLGGAAEDSLAGVEDYQRTMQRSLDDIPEGVPALIRWYIEPLNYGESLRTLLSGPVAEKRKGKTSIFTTLKEQGFDAIRGVGGVVTVKSENYEVVHRTYICVEKPFRLAMKMFVFPDSTNFVPPGWIPEDVARCSMLFVDPIEIFDNFGSFFDHVIMGGEEGVWKDILNGLKEDPDGPQIDVREELVAILGQRVMGMSHYELPITPQSEAIIIAVELKKEGDEKMRKSLEKLFGNDAGMEVIEHNAYRIWKRVPPEDFDPTFTIEGPPSLITPSSSPPAKEPAADPDATNSGAVPAFQEGAVAVAKGCLFIGTNVEYLKVILDRLDATEKLPTIGDEQDYKDVNLVFADMGVTDKPHFLQFFAKTDETLRPTYELVRQGQFMQSQTVLSKVVKAMMAPPEDESQEPQSRQFDGSTLPEFDLIKKYFGCSGVYGATEENGYFIKGFSLERK